MTLLAKKHRPKNLGEINLHKKEANRLKKQLNKSGLPHLLITGQDESFKDNFIYSIAYTSFDGEVEPNLEHISVEEFFSTKKSDLKKDPRYERYFSEAKRELNRVYDKFDIDKRATTVSKETIFKQYIKSVAGNKPVGKNNYRLFVLFEANRLTKNIQNSLRRMMENYSSTTRFAFVLKNSTSLIEAIRSRCFEITLNKPNEETIERKIKKLVKKEEIEITKKAIEAALYSTNYDYTKTIYLIDALDSKYTTKIDINEVKNLLDKIKLNNYRDSIKKALNGEVKEAIKEIDDLIYQENTKFNRLINEWRKTIFRLSVNEETKKELLIKLAELDKETQELPRDPNQMKKLGRNLYEKYLSSITQEG